MTSEHHVVPEHDDLRGEGPMTGAEREMLDHWLDRYRTTTLLKIAGLDAQQLCRRPVPPSNLSLIGVVRHLTEVESYWFRQVVLGQDLASHFCTPESPDGDFEDVSPDTVAADVDSYRDEVAACRRIADAWPDLDAPVRGRRHGRPVNLRWIMVHLIEEYARHLGHMDLLREAVDGRTGD